MYLFIFHVATPSYSQRCHAFQQCRFKFYALLFWFCFNFIAYVGTTLMLMAHGETLSNFVMHLLRQKSESLS